MEYLTIKQTAELKKCSVRYIRKLCSNGKIKTEIRSHPQNKKPCYMIPVTELPENLQAEYYGIKKMIPEKSKSEIIRQLPTIEELSENERSELRFWCELLKDWQARRSQYNHKCDFDNDFIGECRLKYPDIKISTDILYRKLSAFRNKDYYGVIGKHSPWNNGKSSIPEPVWENFLYNWLDENKPSVSICYRNTIDWTAEFYPELLSKIPTEMTFRRRIEKDVSVSVRTLLRDGEKAFNDRCVPYIMRMYDKLSANSCWIADNHTFDIQSYSEENKIHRLYLTAFLDAKSGVLTGWNITESPDSQSTVLALRHGIMRFGIPDCIYVDNGREFLTHDIGGRGHRSGKNIKSVKNPPTIFETLGIEMRNAIVRNAKAKPIERTFCTIKNQFSKLFSGFCGGTVLEKPESLKRRIKDGKLPCDYEIREVFGNWIDGVYNLQEYGGSEKCYKGLTRLDVWNKTSCLIRKAPESALNLMLMRTTRKQKIKRNGVYITICGEKIWFTEPEKTIMNLEREVFIRYNPADLRSVRIYDAQTDKYLFTWAVADTLMADYLEENIDTLSDANAIIRNTKKFVREHIKETVPELTNKQRLTLLDITVRKAQYRKDNKFCIQPPKKIVPVIINEESEKLMVAGSENIIIDLDKMTRNAEMRKKNDVY
ncbi:MAG: Mu transposase C-terminal domain-containing protein [Ruminococcus sp.]|nr:Mu transposase C-terminal domain-containing protein [Ruminococcus sp.]